MTETGFLTPSSAQRTTTRNAPTSASSAWWRSSATVLWPTRSYRCDPFASCDEDHGQAPDTRDGLDSSVRSRPQSNGDLKRKWTWAVEWLGDELERRPYTGNPQYTYNNWSPPVQSNETSNGYFLERSHSARMTLAKACELCPEEVTAPPPSVAHVHTPRDS